MKTERVTFGAKPINKIKILKFDKQTKGFLPEEVSFVKIEPSEVGVIDTLVDKWKGAEYVKKIATASHWMSKIPMELYAITAQKDKFSELEHEKILGLAEMRNDIKPKYKWLYHLQINPEAINVNNADDKKYKLVGRKTIKSLKKIYKRIALYSVDSPNIEKFYQENGFIRDYSAQRHYLWSNSLIDRIKIYINNFRLKFGI